MNILFIKHFFVGFMVSEIPRVSVFEHCPYSVTFPYVTLSDSSLILTSTSTSTSISTSTTTSTSTSTSLSQFKQRRSD